MLDTGVGSKGAKASCFGNNAMARDEKREEIPPAEIADGSGGLWMANRLRNVLIGNGCP